MTALPQSLISAVDEALGAEGKGPVAKWGTVADLLKKHHVSYTVKLRPDEVIVHPMNRGGLGLSWAKAHSIGGKIYAIGGAWEELHKATAFEITDPKGTVLYNELLVADSEGHLAPLTGAERVASVGCGHTTAFMRAANAGCTTEVTAFKDSGEGIVAYSQRWL